MKITFQDLYTVEQPAEWMWQSFQGFNLDSRKVTAGQIFIALTSFSQPEKTANLRSAALENGAMAVDFGN